MAGISRTTKDIDFLISSEDAPKVKKLMLSFGYELIHESEDISSYLSKMVKWGRIDFLQAHRKYTRAMLTRAVDNDILEGRFKIKVLKIEDLIGLKVQASSNDPKRYHQDISDIEYLISNNYGNLDRSLIEEYFALFNRSKELRDILGRIKNVE